MQNFRDNTSAYIVAPNAAVTCLSEGCVPTGIADYVKMTGIGADVPVDSCVPTVEVTYDDTEHLWPHVPRERHTDLLPWHKNNQPGWIRLSTRSGSSACAQLQRAGLNSPSCVFRRHIHYDLYIGQVMPK